MSRPKGSKNKPKKVEAPRIVASSSAPIIKIILKSVGRTYTAEGSTFEDAVNKIKISGGANALSVLTVEQGDIRKEKILNGAHTNALFGQGSPTTKEIHLKIVKSMLGV